MGTPRNGRRRAARSAFTAAAQPVDRARADDILLNDIAGYLDGVVGGFGRGLELELDAPPAMRMPLTPAQVDILAAAAVNGTPARVVHTWEPVVGEAKDLDRLIQWVIEQDQNGAGQDLARVLSGDANLDLSRGDVRLKTKR